MNVLKQNSLQSKEINIKPNSRKFCEILNTIVTVQTNQYDTPPPEKTKQKTHHLLIVHNLLMLASDQFHAQTITIGHCCELSAKCSHLCAIVLQTCINIAEYLTSQIIHVLKRFHIHC